MKRKQGKKHFAPASQSSFGAPPAPAAAPIVSATKWRWYGSDRITRAYRLTLLIAGLLYTTLSLTPSSYGIVLAQLGAPNAAPLWGEPRPIRSDEWGWGTPYVQAAVNNHFERINHTSFYREDLRNINALPLKDWGLLFKPQFWLFFVAPPTIAFSAYWALMMCGFLAGYHLLFRELGADSFWAVCASLALYFCGFTQFWWTTVGPLLVILPWVAWIVLKPLRPLVKTALLAWTVPVWVIAWLYPPLIISSALGIVVLAVAVRRNLLTSIREAAAISAGTLIAAAVVYGYYADLIPVMLHTVYPGHRYSPSGTVPLSMWASQFFPFLTFTLRDYRNLVWPNICETATAGSYLPLLTVCVLRYDALRDRRYWPLLLKLLPLLGVFALITLWQIAPAPNWIGHVLMWDIAVAHRLMYLSGLLLVVACLLLWREDLISVTPGRAALFVLLGPVASWIAKEQLFHVAPADCRFDLALCGAAAVAAAALVWIPDRARRGTILATVALLNIAAFARFNPVQPAGPIFHVPETQVIRSLRRQAAETPGGYLVTPGYFGSILNGLGFRSVSHFLVSPQLGIFRRYFPSMKAEEFNTVFNRHAHIQLTEEPVPYSPQDDVIRVPRWAFEPVRNSRRIVVEKPSAAACSGKPGGAVDSIVVQGNQIVIAGWAPWIGEAASQQILVLSGRPIEARISTIERPDVVEALRNYGLGKSGFRVVLSSADRRPVLAEALSLLAEGTIDGATVLHGCRER